MYANMFTHNNVLDRSVPASSNLPRRGRPLLLQKRQLRRRQYGRCAQFIRQWRTGDTEATTSRLRHVFLTCWRVRWLFRRLWRRWFRRQGVLHVVHYFHWSNYFCRCAFLGMYPRTAPGGSGPKIHRIYQPRTSGILRSMSFRESRHQVNQLYMEVKDSCKALVCMELFQV